MMPIFTGLYKTGAIDLFLKHYRRKEHCNSFCNKCLGISANPVKQGTFNSLTRNFASKSQINKVSLYLQRAKLIDSIRLALRSNAPRSLISLLIDPNLDSFVVANAIRSAPSLDSALSLAEALKTIPHFTHTQHTLHAVAKILAKSQQTAKLKTLVDAINSGKFSNVARVSFMDRLRWYAAARDLDLLLSVWDEWRALQKRPCIEAYNIVMGAYARMAKNSEAVKIFFMMIDEGLVPNSRTYTVIIEHLVNSGKLDSAMQIFSALPLMRIKRTLRQYSLLVRSFTGTKQFDVVKNLLQEMQTDGMLPGQSTLLSLQCMRMAGFIKESVEFSKEILPDERIHNIEASVVDDDDFTNDDIDVSTIHLKPWLDPVALASALNNWRSEEVSALEDANFVWTTRLVCKMIRSFNSAEAAWQFFCWVDYQPGFTHDVYTFSKMISKLAQHGRLDLAGQLLSKTKKEQIKLPVSTVRLIIDFYGIFHNGQAAIKVFRGVKSLCGPLPEPSLLILYSSLLHTLAKCKMNSDVLDIIDEMILDGILPDIQTFSGLIHHFALQRDIKVVQRLFGMVRQGGIEPDAHLFKVLIRAFCKCDRAVLALRIFEDMRNSNLTPDVATRELLVKSLWKEGKLREAASVEERSKEIIGAPPLALRGHLYSVSSTDFTRVCKIYSDSFTTSHC